jgi:septal ring factor EnvC (AmiA/AmiB activator)
MPTQEERLTALEQSATAFQREAAAHIRETEENTTILLGVIRSQGQDIKRIVQHIETIDDRLRTVDERLGMIEQRLNRLDTKSDEQTTLLTQILARLPKTP